MCMYCERRKDIKFGWEQPKLPLHNNMPFGMDLCGNVLENEKWEGTIFDYQTTTPILGLTCDGYFGEGTVGTIQIPIKYCPECGRKLGKYMAKNSKYYFITICNGASDCIPNAEHIERNDEYCCSHEREDIDDFKAAELAMEDGIKLIDDIDGIYKNFYIDSEDNRKIIKEYMEMFPEKVGKELKGIYD